MAKSRLDHFFKTAKEGREEGVKAGSTFVQVENSYEVKVD